MTAFPANPARLDPYKNFKFLVKWDGKYVTGISRISTLGRTTEVVEHREGGDPSTDNKSPGRTKFEAITLERGVTQDQAFEQWANAVWQWGGGLADFLKDVRIELHNEAGQVVMAFNVLRCWPSDYVALAGLDSEANAIAIERITLQNEGWERDMTMTGPPEPK